MCEKTGADATGGNNRAREEYAGVWSGTFSDANGKPFQRDSQVEPGVRMGVQEQRDRDSRLSLFDSAVSTQAPRLLDKHKVTRASREHRSQAPAVKEKPERKK
ncbi:hypothetical protein GN956_G24307 [Arapaima gigas]